MRKVFVVCFVTLLMTLGTVSAALASPAGDLTSANAIVEKALGLARQGDLVGAKTTYGLFRKTWYDIEDGIREQSKAAYVAIEDEMGNVQFAFLQSPLDQSKVVAALKVLTEVNQRFISGGFAAPAVPATPNPAVNGGTATGATGAQTSATAAASTANSTPSATTSSATDSVTTSSATAAVTTSGSTTPATATAPTAAGNLTAANATVLKALGLAEQGDLTGAKTTYDQFRQRWLEIEDGIRQQSKTAYRAIEEEMGTVQFALIQNSPDQSKVVSALKALSEANQRFVSGGYAAGADQGAGVGSTGNVAGLLTLLDQAEERIKAKDALGAARAMDQFRKSWLEVEGVVLTQSAKIYSDAENDMVVGYALLTSNPPDLDRAFSVINRMREYLAPIAGKSAYTAFDAATILLREGMEALLVVVALLGFLNKAGHSDKSKWIWGGVGVGLAVSAVLAICIKVLFGSGAFGNNNFLIVGWTGLFAAVMLVWVSYWLHSKSSVAEWQRYIREKSTAALATGSLVSLSMLSFLAVFREGTETVLFYVGMASSISMNKLLLGLALGLGLLALVAVAMLKVGLRIPMRPFFRFASLFVFYLGFKFLGTGIHGLQLAGLLPAHLAAHLPSVEFLALYPNWESTLPQFALLLIALATAVISQRNDRAVARQLGSQQA